MSYEFEGFDAGVFDTPDEEQIAEQEIPADAPLHAPAPLGMNMGTWSWSPNSILWVAAGALVLGFAAWFLMSFNAAKARAIAEAVSDDDNS